jgi:hypothetical protein
MKFQNYPQKMSGIARSHQQNNNQKFNKNA